jgi:hypothetical protein
MNGQYFSESNEHNRDSHKIEILQRLAINDMSDKVFSTSLLFFNIKSFV